MAEDTTTSRFVLELGDEISEPSAQAARALTSLRERIAEDTASLGEMQKAMRQLKVAGQGSTAEFQAIKDAVTRKQQAVAEANKKYLELGGTFRKIKPPDSVPEHLARIAREAGAMPGPLGRMAGAAANTIAKLTAAKVAAALVAAGIVALTAVTVKALRSLYDYATAQAGARKMELLRLEGLTRIRTAFSLTYGLGRDKAGELQATLDRVAASTSAGREKLAGYMRQLEMMGVRGKNVGTILEAMAMKSEVQGEAQAQMFASYAAGLALTGGNVQRFADRVKRDIGGIASKMLLNADVQAQKLRESLAAMSDGIDTGALDKARAKFYALFSQSTASGRALKQLLHDVVQPLVDAMAAAYPRIKHFFQELIIFALRVQQRYLLLRLDFQRALSIDAWERLKRSASEWKDELIAAGAGVASMLVVTLAPAFASMAAAAWAGTASAAAALFAMIPSIVAAIANMAILGATTIAATWPFIAIAAGVWLLIKAIRWIASGEAAKAVRAFGKVVADALLWIGGKLGAATRWFAAGGAKLAKALWQGIVGGIKGAYGFVADAVKGLASAAVGAFSKLIDAHSPSRVFARLGLTIPQGVQVGVQQGAPDAQRAVDRMITPSIMPSAPVPAQRPAPVASLGDTARQARAAGGGGVTISQLTVSTNSDKPQAIALEIRRELERVLEGVALSMAAPVPGT